MEQRIRDFELLWNALFHPAFVLPPPPLVRSTCEHWTLPEAELARWFAAPTVAERDAILAANRTECRYSWNDQDLEQPREDWLQRTTGQRIALPAEEFDLWASGEKQFIVEHLSKFSIFDELEDQDTLQAHAQDPVQAQDAQAQYTFPAPLIAPLLNPLPDYCYNARTDYDKGDA